MDHGSIPSPWKPGEKISVANQKSIPKRPLDEKKTFKSVVFKGFSFRPMALSSGPSSCALQWLVLPPKKAAPSDWITRKSNNVHSPLQLPIFNDEGRCPFSKHGTCGIDVAREDVRHGGCICHSKTFHSINTKLQVYHSFCFLFWSHSSRATMVIDRLTMTLDVLQDVLIRALVMGNFRVQNLTLDPLFTSWGSHDFSGLPMCSQSNLQIMRVSQVARIQQRILKILRLQLHRASTSRHQKSWKEGDSFCSIESRSNWYKWKLPGPKRKHVKLNVVSSLRRTTLNTWLAEGHCPDRRVAENTSPTDVLSKTSEQTLRKVEISFKPMQSISNPNSHISTKEIDSLANWARGCRGKFHWKDELDWRVRAAWLWTQPSTSNGHTSFDQQEGRPHILCPFHLGVPSAQYQIASATEVWQWHRCIGSLL